MSTWKPTDDKDNKRYQNDSFQNRSLSQSKELNTSSMTTLILWNINKALEKNPTLDLKTALLNAQDKLESEHGNVSAIVNQRPDERHLSCALLAWQQLGHCHVDSLYSFVVAQMKAEPKTQTSSPRPGQSNMGSSKVPYARSLITHKEPDFMFSPISSNISPPTMGPVLRLPSSRPAPVASRVAMPGPSTTWVAMPAPIAPVPVIPVYNVQGGGGCSALRKTGQDLKKRIESACCLESACLEHFTAVDRSTKELRMRLSRLAKREADRIELLSRAEAAWRDLEMGYIRRLRTNVEKEDEIKRRGAKTIAERNADKEACVKIVASLKPCGEVAEKIKLTLGSLEKNVCDLACESLKQRELAAKEDSTLCELQCQANRQDRDLQFREEAARRKKASLENEVESVRGLAYEIERTIKAELKGFEAQIKAVANELLAENEEIDKLKKERDELAEEKQEIVEDLEGCQKKCDDSMKKNLDELKEKRDKLFKLKDQTLECKCKFPMESAVQVKRTPSFAALCYCSPEDKLKKTCSCMSMRSRLLSDLIVTLFEGLQFELADCSIKMPCELLKCLEDSFNWDKGSHVKSNLRAFFAKMLCGELDIAIVNSIDNYHARYVGASCADKGRSIQNLTDSNIQRWEDRALAEKARLMAETMAEQMYQERVDDIMDEAHKVVKEGPPPCKCKPPPNLNKEDTAVYQLLVNPVVMSDNAPQECFSPVQQPLPISSTSDNEPTASDAVVAATRIKQKKKAKETKNTAKIFKEPPSSIVARTFKNDVLLLKAEIAGLKKVRLSL
ncbi:hypothetical protein O0L34_g12456 [Tuta absoluta]|nr:hypothetical protein O0L34_g12456 [Tuta absoluta]